jgi:F-type H+-transporting ATPase subunit b
VLIDWFTVVAELINFLILFLLLKRFLFKPVVNAMDKREAMIANRLNEAERSLEEGERVKSEYEQMQARIQREHEELMTEAHRQAEQRRKELTDQAAAEVTALEQRWHESIEREREAFARDLSQRAGEKVCSIARLALADLAGEDLEEHIAAVFVERIHQLPEAKSRRIKEAIRRSDHRVTITSSFPLTDEGRDSIRDSLRRLVGRDVDVAFGTSASVVCGIDMRAQEYKLAFSLGDYLERLQAELEVELQEESIVRQGG